MKRAGFFKNAVILTATALVLRLLGMIFRVYLSGKLGEEGMGLYQLIVSVYAFFSTFATAGICTAVTRLCAEQRACGKEGAAVAILKKATRLSVAVGVLSAATVFIGAPFISRLWLRDMRAVAALRALSASLPFMGISSCLRGYFVSARQVSAPSRTQLLEQAVRIGTVFLLLPQVLPYGTALSCAAVFVADTVAEAVACAVLAWCTRRSVRGLSKKEQRVPRVWKRIGEIALPITGGRYLHTALRTVENLLTPTCLMRSGLSAQTALAAFGSLKGMALPLLFFPSSFLTALSTLLLPEVSAASALGQDRRVKATVEQTLRITLLSSVLLGGVFYGCADAFGWAVYRSEQVGFYLRVLAPLVPLMYLESMVDGILKGLGQQVATLRYSVTDSALRILAIVLLVPRWGMRGFLFVMLLSNLLTALLNIGRLLRVTRASLQVGKWIALPLCAVTTAVVVSATLTRALSSLPLWQAAVGTTVTAATYLLLLWGFGCLDKELLCMRKGLDTFSRDNV